MVVLGLGLVLLMGMQVFAAQIGNMIFSPGRIRPFVAYGDGRKAPIFDDISQIVYRRHTIFNCKFSMM
jgi:hypothetical protein